MADWRRLSVGRYAATTTNGFVVVVARLPDGGWAILYPIPVEVGEDLDLREFLDDGERTRGDLVAYRDVLRPFHVAGTVEEAQECAVGLADYTERDGLIAAPWRSYAARIAALADARIAAVEAERQAILDARSGAKGG